MSTAQPPAWKRAIGPVLIALIVMGANTACGADSDAADSAGKSEPSKQQPSSTESTGGGSKVESPGEIPESFGSTKLPLNHGDWRLDSLDVTKDGSGSFAGTARITYTGKDDSGGNNTFTITVLKRRELVGVLQGGAVAVHPGQTVTAKLSSQDKFTKGPYEYDFTSDL